MPEAAVSVAAKKARAEAKKKNSLTYYDPAFCDQAFKMCLLGAKLPDLASFFGVYLSTIYNWVDRQPEFAKAVRSGQEIADAEVAERLYRRALGYTHKETKVFCNSDGQVTKVKIDKHYPPDTAAAAMWLRCRQPDRWREKETISTPADDAAKILAALADKLPG